MSRCPKETKLQDKTFIKCPKCKRGIAQFLYSSIYNCSVCGEINLNQRVNKFGTLASVVKKIDKKLKTRQRIENNRIILREKRRIIANNWNRKNREKVNGWALRYYSKNKEKIKPKHREYYKKHAEKLRQRSTDYRLNHKDKVSELKRKYYKKNRDKILLNYRLKYKGKYKNKQEKK